MPTTNMRPPRCSVIDGGCPLMFGPTADLGHKVMGSVYGRNVPKEV